ncbi:MAG: CARDB domain-containing protein [Thermoplasmata archaeon]
MSGSNDHSLAPRKALRPNPGVRLLVLPALVAALILPIIQNSVAGADTPGTAVAISGPDRLEVSTDAVYNIRIYGPEGIKWGFELEMKGKNLEGGYITSPAGRTEEENKYKMVHDRPLEQPEFNVTLHAPSKAGEIALQLAVTALEGEAAAGQKAKARWPISIRNKREVMINATVRNTGETRVEGLLVAFYVRLEGRWLNFANQSVPVIEPGGRENVSAVWNAALVDNGEYRVRIVLDPEHKKPLFSESGSVIEKTIVLKEPGAQGPKPISPVVLALVAFALVGGAVSIYYWYRKKKIV